MTINWSEELQKELDNLIDKYALSGQESIDFVRGLNNTRYLNYWDYIHLDVLLNLQKPRTILDDEKIFITYHQITELYFSLISHELDKIRTCVSSSEDAWLKMLDRVNRYYKQLIQSFDIMIYGLDREDFLMFRMALLPASGFQSVQYRIIELSCTQLKNLVSPHCDIKFTEQTAFETVYEYIYWKFSNRMKNNKKALTLTLFEEKYDHMLLTQAKERQDANLATRYIQASAAIKNHPDIIEGLRKLDKLANIAWPLKHFEAAALFLQEKNQFKKATGGTNWQQYLPPKLQSIQYFPFLFSQEEISDWGKKASWEEWLFD